MTLINASHKLSILICNVNASQKLQQFPHLLVQPLKGLLFCVTDSEE